jgi:tetratricopeptide (TPR) repeat protein
MKRAILSLFLWSMFLPVLGSCSAAQDREMITKLFAQGNSEYQQQNYAAAEQYYARILKAGAESGAVYYNLGNACFKQKKLGEAIYYWEKAQQKFPSDQDARENLEFANLMIVDRIETPADPLPMRILSALPRLLTISQESRLVLGLFILANILFSVSLLTKSTRSSYRALIASLVIACVFVIFGCSLCWKIYDRDYRKKGIVVEQKVDVRSGPGPENITVFTVHEGIKVRVHEATNGWYQISLPNGWNGWLPQSYVRML